MLATTQLYRAPSGAGKTESALQAIRAVLEGAQGDALPQVWVLLASQRQENAFRQRLIDHFGAGYAAFNLAFFTFYDLADHLLTLAAYPAINISDATRLALLGQLAQQLAQTGALSHYGSIAHTQGFADLLLQWFNELKQGRIPPQLLLQAAQQPKEQELAALYQRYQDTLQAAKLVDIDGESWLALALLETPDADDNPAQHKRLIDRLQQVSLLVVDGYDQFTRVQADTIAQLSRHIQRVAITLTALAGREQSIGSRFEAARADLEAAYQRCYGEAWAQHMQSITLSADPHAARADDLNHLLDHIFLARHSDRPLQQPSLHCIEAPSKADEAAAVLRDLRTQLAAGTPPDDCLIVLRDWEGYQSAIRHGATAYGIPVLLHRPARDATPLLATLLDALALLQRDYEAVRLLDVLRSPYFSLPCPDATVRAQAPAWLAWLSQTQSIVGGLANWQRALAALAAGHTLHGDDQRPKPPPFSAEQARLLSEALTAFHAWFSPPLEGTLADYIRWLEDILGADRFSDDDDEAFADSPPIAHAETLVACLRRLDEASEAATDPNALRDWQTLRDLKRLLRDWLRAHTILHDRLKTTPHYHASGFLTEFEALLASVSTQERTPFRTGRVLVTTASAARGLPHALVYVLGLAESVFPAPTHADPLMLDSEREVLNQSFQALAPTMGYRVALQAERANDDGLFYELISLPTRRLVLSRPTLREGKPWNASHLWNLARACFAPASLVTETLGIGQAVPLASAATWEESAIAAAEALNAGQVPAPTLAWLASEAPLAWAAIQRGQAVEMRRMSDAPHDAYTGVLSLADHRAEVGEQLHKRVWSASQLNNLGKCRYKFFAQYLLKIPERETAEEGTDILSLGSIYHALLEAAYRPLIGKRIHASATAHRDQALAALRVAATGIFADAPQQYGFAPSPAWQEEQRRIIAMLGSFIEADFSAQPLLLNKETKSKPATGLLKERRVLALEYELNTSIELGGQAIRVRGFVDRIDLHGDAGFIIIDYKSSSGKEAYALGQLQNGRNVQMLIYLKAVQQMMTAGAFGAEHQQRQADGAAFWSLANGKPLGLTLRHEHQTALDEGEQAILQQIQRAQAADFAEAPTELNEGKCDTYCPYFQLCRIAHTHLDKQGS